MNKELYEWGFTLGKEAKKDREHIKTQIILLTDGRQNVERALSFITGLAGTYKKTVPMIILSEREKVTWTILLEIFIGINNGCLE